MSASLRALLDANVDRIVDDWDSRRKDAAAARGLTRAERVSRLPALLGTLVHGESSASDSARASRRWLVVAHLADRLRQGFVLGDMVEELRVLGDSIEASCAGLDVAARPDGAEIARMREELSEGAEAAAALFREDLVLHQQSEKQFLRRLQTIAADAPGEASSEPWLEPDKMLEVISEALGAEASGLYYYEPKRRELTLAASTGVEGDAIPDPVTPAGAPTFAARLAESSGTIYLADLATSGLAVPDGLRRTGVRSVLAMPLLSKGVLSGALYVGVRASRLFAPWEVRMFETLGERLASLLDSARAHRDLLAMNQELRNERELRERFVAVLAHDLLGPLGSAKMGIQLLLSHPDLISEKSTVPARILFDLDRTDGMVRDLLDVHQIRAGRRLTLRIGKMDLVALAREVVEELTRQYGERFVVVANEHAWGFWSTRDLRRALWNLASNAIKYGGHTTPVEIRIASSSDGVDIAVHNEGAPIAESDRDVLFEPFARAEPRAAERGWGLGLTLVKGCAEAHGGVVEIASSAERGTTFTMRFPLDARPFQPQSSRASA